VFSVGPGPVVFVDQGRRVFMVRVMLALGRVSNAGIGNMVARDCNLNGCSMFRVICHGH